tara:strand:+ start:6785 stop:8158 length:1374 start_codon:yes stop_codon:yes gene_type:complete
MNTFFDYKTSTQVDFTEQAYINADLNINRQGFTDEKNVFKVYGRGKVGSTINLGTLKISASQQAGVERRFGVAPNIEAVGVDDINNNNNLYTRLVEITKDSEGNKIAYTYDVMYQLNDPVPRGPLSFRIRENPIKKLSARSNVIGILGVEVGDSIVKPGGEIRKITTTGSVDSSMYLIVNKITDIKDSLGNITDTQEESILPKGIETGDVVGIGKHGEGFVATKIFIPKSGKFSYFQKFPAETSETRYALRIISSSLQGGFNASLWEKGQDSSISGFSGYMQRILTQVVNPTLTLKTITTWSNATVDTTGSGTFVTFSNVAPITKTYKGRYDTSSKQIKTTTVKKLVHTTHIFKASSGAFALRSGSDGAGGTLGAPLYSRFRGEESDWTNSFPFDDTADGQEGNGGTVVNIDGISVVISTTSTSNDTITIRYSVAIEKWGTKDLTMELDVDKIATLT